MAKKKGSKVRTRPSKTPKDLVVRDGRILELFARGETSHTVQRELGAEWDIGYRAMRKHISAALQRHREALPDVTLRAWQRLHQAEALYHQALEKGDLPTAQKVLQGICRMEGHYLGGGAAQTPAEIRAMLLDLVGRQAWTPEELGRLRATVAELGHGPGQVAAHGVDDLLPQRHGPPGYTH